MGLIALAEAAYDYSPRLSIDAVTFDESDPMATLFRVTNIGRVSVSNISFRCQMTDNRRKIFLQGNVVSDLAGTVSGQGDVAVLRSGRAETRDCAANSMFNNILNIAALKIDVVASYDWPLFGLRASESQHFTTRRIAGKKLILVPDTES